MANFDFLRWVLAGLAGALVMVGFDALFHGLSHAGHGPLDRIWRQEPSERNTRTSGLSAIGWHVATDALLGVILSLLVALLGQAGIQSGVKIGILIGVVVALYWSHVYAAFEIKGRTILTLAGLSLLQITLTSVACTWIYWGM